MCRTSRTAVYGLVWRTYSGWNNKHEKRIVKLPTKKIMVYDIKWIIPALRSPTRLWSIASTFAVVAVGLFSKILIKWLNKSKIHNRKVMVDAFEKRPKNVPLVTVSNHHSCFDDPGIWGTLKIKNLINASKMRWSLAAHDICFTCSQHAVFFSLGKCIPVIRGAGVYQQAVDFCIEQLAKGGWVHIFPEGKVNMTKENMRLKWGVGRMIYESPITPIIIPIWHIGMDDVLPNEPPYVLRLRKNLTFNYGEPIDLSDMVKELRDTKVSEELARKRITDFIQDTLLKLKDETEKLHASNYKIKNHLLCKNTNNLNNQNKESNCSNTKSS